MMSKKIVVLDSKTMGSEKDVSIFSDCGIVTIYKETSKEDRIKNIGDAEIVITNKVIIDKLIIDECKNLRLVCLTATGMNNVDLEYAKAKNIQVKNVAGYSTESVAQTTFAVALELTNRISFYNTFVMSGGYSNHDAFTYLGPTIHELSGKKWGIIGLGNIGRRVADLAKAFGCEVLYYSTSGRNNNFEYIKCELDELLTSCDIVSIHAPLNDVTQNIITKKELNLMKKNSILINMGRGGIVNENDLANALADDRISGAGLDVLVNEPIEKDNPLLKLKNKNLIILPHIAWSSVEAREKLLKLTKQNVLDYIG